MNVNGGNYSDDESMPLTSSNRNKNNNDNAAAERALRKKKKWRKDWCIAAGTIVPAVLALLLCLRLLLSPRSLFDNNNHHNGEPPEDDNYNNQKHKHHFQRINAQSLFDEHDRFVLEDYDARPTFSDFLPGVAGVYGKPLWAFFVNRGQGIASFGTTSKQYPIMEFMAADKAYQQTALTGFRTLVQVTRKKQSFQVEPFSPMTTKYHDNDKMLPKRTMYVGTNEMQLQEIDSLHRIETNVTYFILPEEDFGALVRRTTITNLDTKNPIQLSVLDGLARMQPAGGKMERLLKTMSRTLQGWMGVSFADDLEKKTMPFYRLSTQPSDKATVTVQEHGHYCLSLIESGGEVENGGTTNQLLPIVYDTSAVFGQDSMLLNPVGLESKSVADILKAPQYGSAKTSSAFAALSDVTLGPGQSVTIASFYGKAAKITDVPVIARRVTQPGFVLYKFTRAREIINQITASVETHTANKLWNGHVQQMFLDNSLRGGIPIILGEVTDESTLQNVDENKELKVYHLFSRIHGDLERDYNDFKIDPTFFSQGPGNFRDVAQNRRSDIFFNPRIASFNVQMFLSYIQADGYEPLSVEAVVFAINDKAVCDQLALQAVGYADGHRAQREALSKILNAGPFRPGQLFELMEDQNIELIMSRQNFIDRVAAASESLPMAVFSEGYWADHWDYYMDLIESYLAVYPDGEEHLMFDESLPYFFSPASVQPRSKKYVLSVSFDGKGKHVRQLEATKQKDKEKLKFQMNYIDNATGWFDVEANWQRTVNGKVFSSSAIAKLFLLATLKFATRDAYGMGVEYEAGKPGWNDAMNGLVGMVGSGMPETFELEILLHYILDTVSKYRRPVVIPMELGTLIRSINSALDELSDYPIDVSADLKAKVPDHLFRYWDTVATAREDYRRSIRVHVSGKTMALPTDDMIALLKRWIIEINIGKSRAISIGSHGFQDDGRSGITPTYFSYNVTKWKLTGSHNKDGHPFVEPLAMEVGRFPLFLEGPVRLMKSVDPGQARSIYEHVRQSALRDEGLGMYTISANLQGQSYDMGRMMAFTPGWLENQSVWLHMSYKFYLELLRKHMYHEFYTETTSGGILPFMDPETYGRSLMECSSFIASSAFEDPSARGRGFLARLSGSTAEFLSMWVLIMIGPKPFYIDSSSRELRMQLLPALPLWMFQSDEEKKVWIKPEDPLTVSFKLFSSISVTYYNKRRTDLFRVPPSRYVVGLRDGSRMDVEGPSIPFDLADKIRRVTLVEYIEAFFE